MDADIKEHIENYWHKFKDHTSVGPQLSNLMKQLQTQQNIVRSDLLRTQEEIKTRHAKESLAVLYLELKNENDKLEKEIKAKQKQHKEELKTLKERLQKEGEEALMKKREEVNELDKVLQVLRIEYDMTKEDLKEKEQGLRNEIEALKAVCDMQFEDGAQANYIEGITKKVQHEANLCKSWSSENSSLKARIELLQMEIQEVPELERQLREKKEELKQLQKNQNEQNVVNLSNITNSDATSSSTNLTVPYEKPDMSSNTLSKSSSNDENPDSNITPQNPSFTFDSLANTLSNINPNNVNVLCQDSNLTKDSVAENSTLISTAMPSFTNSNFNCNAKSLDVSFASLAKLGASSGQSKSESNIQSCPNFGKTYTPGYRSEKPILSHVRQRMNVSNTERPQEVEPLRKKRKLYNPGENDDVLEFDN